MQVVQYTCALFSFASLFFISSRLSNSTVRTCVRPTWKCRWRNKTGRNDFFAILHSAPSLFFFCSYFFFNAATIREGSPPPPPPSLSFARTENPKSEEGESLWNSGEGGAGATFFETRHPICQMKRRKFLFFFEKRTPPPSSSDS